MTGLNVKDCHFLDFYRGITLKNTFCRNLQIYLNNTEFANCGTGFEADGISKADIKDCTFLLNEFQTGYRILNTDMVNLDNSLVETIKTNLTCYKCHHKILSGNGKNGCRGMMELQEAVISRTPLRGTR